MELLEGLKWNVPIHCVPFKSTRDIKLRGPLQSSRPKYEKHVFLVVAKRRTGLCRMSYRHAVAQLTRHWTRLPRKAKRTWGLSSARQLQRSPGECCHVKIVEGSTNCTSTRCFFVSGGVLCFTLLEVKVVGPLRCVAVFTFFWGRGGFKHKEVVVPVIFRRANEQSF